MSFLYIDDGVLGSSEGKPLVFFPKKYNNALVLTVKDERIVKYLSYDVIREDFHLTDDIITIFSPLIPTSGRIYKYNHMKLKNKLGEHAIFMSNDLDTDFKHSYYSWFYIFLAALILLILFIVFIFVYKIGYFGRGEKRKNKNTAI